MRRGVAGEELVQQRSAAVVAVGGDAARHATRPHDGDDAVDLARIESHVALAERLQHLGDERRHVARSRDRVDGVDEARRPAGPPRVDASCNVFISLSTLLTRFVLTASLARIVSEGFALALVLLTLDRTGSTAAAGWLIAVATLPQLATGPCSARCSTASAHPWRVLRLAAAAVTAVAALVIVVSVDRWPFVVPVAAALAIACTEPLLTGGVSATGGRGPWATRVYAWDSLAYNVAGLAGPALVTVVAVAASPAWALATLAVAGRRATTVTSLGLGVTTASEHVPAGGRPSARRCG